METTELKKPEMPKDNPQKWINYWKSMNERLGYNHFEPQIKSIKQELEKGCRRKFREFSNGARGYMKYNLICNEESKCLECKKLIKQLGELLS